MTDNMDVLGEALNRFSQIQSSQAFVRNQCNLDRRFYSVTGAQWEDGFCRGFDNKPRFEINKIHLSIIRLINEYRNNQVHVQFFADPLPDEMEQELADKIAETCEGLLRADEQDSDAYLAYTNGFEEAVGGGFGAFRLCAEYYDDEDDEDERQKIKIQPIFDADISVYFDTDAKKQDKSDARYCFVISTMSLEAYKQEYKDDPASWPSSIFNNTLGFARDYWITKDIVRIAEYYVLEKKTETIRVFRGLLDDEVSYSDDDFEEDETLEEELKSTGYTEVRRRKIKKNKVRKYILSAAKVLEDCGYLPGKHIPIIPVFGKRWYIDGVEHCMGHVRLAKDPQRLKNMQYSRLAEISALSPVEKPIFTPEQIKGFESMYRSDNVENYSVMMVNLLKDPVGNLLPTQGPLAYTKPPSIPQATAALLELTEMDIKDILGNQQEGEKIMGGISGTVVEKIQEKIDALAYIYLSNFAIAMKRCGEVWLEMAKELYFEPGRKMKTISKEGAQGTVQLYKSTINKNGAISYENDIKKARLTVQVEVGPSGTTKRQNIVKSLTGLMQYVQDPNEALVISLMAINNMDGDGLADYRAYARNRLVKLGVLKPTEEEMKEMQAEQANQQPDANQIYLMSAAKEAEAKANKTNAEISNVLANTQLTKAKTIETLSGVNKQQ